MKQRLLVILAVVVVLTLSQVGTAHAEGISKWTKDQQYLWGAYTLAWAVDFGYTRHQSKNQGRYYEDGATAWLTEHPSIGRVNNVFAVWYVGTYAIATQLPEDLRTVWLIACFASHMVENANSGSTVGMQIDWEF